MKAGKIRQKTYSKYERKTLLIFVIKQISKHLIHSLTISNFKKLNI